MRNWTNTLTVIVPESLMVQANRLALAIGTSEDDINTFHSADWTDGTSNYAVAHTVAVEQIMDYFGAITPDAGSELATAIGNTVFPQVLLSETGFGVLDVDMSKIQVFVDAEPFTVFGLLNLTRRPVDVIV
jgi:hypothetical protein